MWNPREIGMFRRFCGTVLTFDGDLPSVSSQRREICVKMSVRQKGADEEHLPRGSSNWKRFCMLDLVQITCLSLTTKGQCKRMERLQSKSMGIETKADCNKAGHSNSAWSVTVQTVCKVILTREHRDKTKKGKYTNQEKDYDRDPCHYEHVGQA